MIGFFQELGAHRSLEALKKISTVRATVIRDGKIRTVEARQLVPGDIVQLEAGDRVPADLRIIEAVQLKVEESALTGESVPVEKSARVICRLMSPSVTGATCCFPPPRWPPATPGPWS